MPRLCPRPGPGRLTGGGMKTLPFILAGVFLISPMPATAEHAAGPAFLSFTFDGASIQFGPDRAGMTRFAMLDAISLEGVADRARLVVKFALPPEAGLDAHPLDARVTYRPDGFADFWQSIDAPGPGAFVFDAVQLSGPGPRVAGRFEVTLCRRASVMVQADRSDCRAAKGAFATELQID